MGSSWQINLRACVTPPSGSQGYGAANEPNGRCQTRSGRRKMPIHSESLFSGCDVRPECGRSAASSCLVSDQGLSKKHIARAFEISPDSVKSHVKHILLKLVRIWGVDPHGPPSQENMWQRIHPD